MKKGILFIVITLLLFSCSSPLTTIKSPNLKPGTYKKILLVSETYYSDKSGFKKLFDVDIQNHEIVSKTNQGVVQRLLQHYTAKQINIQRYLVSVNLEPELVLNQRNKNEIIQENIDAIVKNENIDLVLTIYAQNIKRVYQPGITSGTGVSFGGNPNIGLQATTNSSNLSFTYVFTAIDTKTHLEVWKGKLEVDHANNIFNNKSKTVSKKLIEKIKQDQLF